MSSTASSPTMRWAYGPGNDPAGCPGPCRFRCNARSRGLELGHAAGRAGPGRRPADRWSAQGLETGAFPAIDGHVEFSCALADRISPWSAWCPAARAGPCAVQVMGFRRVIDGQRKKCSFTLTQYRAPVAVPVLRHPQQQAAPSRLGRRPERIQGRRS